MDAYLEGLERARNSGKDLSPMASVASFFVSRVDTEIDKRLNKIGSDEALGAARQGGCRQRPARLQAIRAGVLQRAGGGRSQKAGAKPQRPLWASTGVKDPEYADTMYVPIWPLPAA